MPYSKSRNKPRGNPVVKALLALPDVPYCTDRGDPSSLNSRRCVVSMQRRAMFRRTEDKIRSLSQQLLAAESDPELTAIVGELRAALRQHVERFRARVASYPIVVERRSYPATEESSNRSGGSQNSRSA